MWLLLEITSAIQAWLCLFLMIFCGVLLIVGKVVQHKRNQRELDDVIKGMHSRRGEISKLTDKELRHRHRELCRVLNDEEHPFEGHDFTIREWMRKEMRRRGLPI